MKQNFDLSQMGLMELSDADNCHVNGGNWLAKLVGAVVSGPAATVLAVVGAIEVLQDAASGFAEGYNYGRAHK